MIFGSNTAVTSHLDHVKRVQLLEIVTPSTSSTLGVWELWESTAQTSITGENQSTLFYANKFRKRKNHWDENKPGTRLGWKCWTLKCFLEKRRNSWFKVFRLLLFYCKHFLQTFREQLHSFTTEWSQQEKGFKTVIIGKIAIFCLHSSRMTDSWVEK